MEGAMKKSDVRRSYHQGSRGEPMVNVKWSPYWRDIVRKFNGTKAVGRLGEYTVHEFGDDAEFWAWAEDLYENHEDEAFHYPACRHERMGAFLIADEIAREVGWELAQELADEVWEKTRYSPKVYSAGRSGGWLVVTGLPDVEAWDAIDLARWACFQKEIEATVDDLDYQFIWHLHVNVYENLAAGFI